MTNFTWEDLESFCNDLSDWIVKLDLCEELQKASPRSSFPLKPDEKDDTIDEGLDVLLYLTLWMCLKANTKAPPHLESRIFLAPNTRGPWKKLYAKLCLALDEKQKVSKIEDIWHLAG